MHLQMGAPITVLYRGGLQDTASLVGLAYSGVSVGLIAFNGKPTDELIKYCEILSAWLQAKGLPPISMRPSLTTIDLNCVVNRPHELWGWGATECRAAIHLANLPLPPSEFAS